MDLAKKISFLTLDAISAVGLGKSFGMLAADEDVDDYHKSSGEGVWFWNMTVALGLRWLFDIPGISGLLAPSTNDSKGFGKMLSTAHAIVDERVLHPTDSRSDMLASFRRHGLTREELRTESMLQIMAGSDTTATAIKGIMLYLMTNQRVYSNLKREIDSAAERGAVPKSPGVISTTQASTLPYLQAVIREGLRVWPPVTDTFPRDVPAGGDTVIIDGQSVFLPGGCQIGYSALAMHHDRKLYGEDAKCFRPERWFTEDKEKTAAMIRTNELIFGHGKWHCLGQPFAQVEIAKTVFEVRIMNGLARCSTHFSPVAVLQLADTYSFSATSTGNSLPLRGLGLRPITWVSL